MWLTRQGQAREVDVPGGGSNGAMHAEQLTPGEASI